MPLHHISVYISDDEPLDAHPSDWLVEAFNTSLASTTYHARTRGGEVLIALHANKQSTIFDTHSCAACRDGTLSCRNGHPNRCDLPHARND